MPLDQIDEMGPIDIVAIGFPPDAPMTGEAVPLLLDLVERGIIRVMTAPGSLLNNSTKPSSAFCSTSST